MAEGALNLFWSAVRPASTKNAPGARPKMVILKSSGMISIPKNAPLPKSSRKMAIQVRPTVKPKPMPIPSNADSATPFFAA